MTGYSYGNIYIYMYINFYHILDIITKVHIQEFCEAIPETVFIRTCICADKISASKRVCSKRLRSLL